MSERPSGFIERLNKKSSVPVARLLVNASWITPNKITWTSALVAGVLAPWAIVSGLNIPAAILVLAGAWLDSLDGDLAQARQCGTKEGEILDAVLDRYIDFAIIASLIWQTPECLLAGLAALLGNQMVPYLRARTEAAGKASVATFGSRDIRNMLMVVGLLGGWYCALLIVLALIANASALHRFYHSTRRST
ncbi:MAG: CDP-alcohol phosphatidyltransferase family protein [Acidobacteriota bacterium]